MRRPGRWMLNAFNVFSLILCGIGLVLWISSYWQDQALLTFHLLGEHRQLAVNQGWIRIDNAPQCAEARIEAARLRERILELYCRRGGKVMSGGRSGLLPPPLPDDPREEVAEYLDDGNSIPISLPDKRDPATAEYQALVAKWLMTSTANPPRASRAPMPLALLLFAALPITRTLRRRSGKRRWPVNRFCPSCRYNLTGNTSGICPECGSTITKRKHRSGPTPS